MTTPARSSSNRGGFTILEMIEESRQDTVVEQIRSSFDWAIPA